MTAPALSLAGTDRQTLPERTMPNSTDAEVLETLGFRPDLNAIIFRKNAPLYTADECLVPQCTLFTDFRVCRSHLMDAKAAGLTVGVDDLSSLARLTRPELLSFLCLICRTPGHMRLQRRGSCRLCVEHVEEFRRWTDDRLTFESRDRWVKQCGPSPLVNDQVCAVLGCDFPPKRSALLCHGHSTVWNRHRRTYEVTAQDEDEMLRWIAISHFGWTRVVPLWHLTDHFRHDLLAGLVLAARHGARATTPTILKTVVIASQRHLEELEDFPTRTKGDLEVVGARFSRQLARYLRRSQSSPETERELDVWDVPIWGSREGVLRFTGISQPWLRQLAKDWAFDDLPTRPTSANGATTKRHVDAIVTLSQVLAQRPDGGNDPAALSRADIDSFLDHWNAAVLDRRSTQQTMVQQIQRTRLVLAWARETAWDKVQLQDRFMIRKADVPARLDGVGRPRASEEESGRALADAQMRAFMAALPAVEAAHGFRGRAFAELLILTGRRPNEIAALVVGSFRHRRRHTENGETVTGPYLHYFSSKANRWHSIFIDEETAALLQRLCDLNRADYPETPDDELKLFPTKVANGYGRTAVRPQFTTKIFATWMKDEGVIRALVDRPRTIAYDFRHTFAQRHADAGVPIDVLQDLMGHAAADSTRVYYDVNAQRRLDAVAVMRQFRFDRTGTLLDTHKATSSTSRCNELDSPASRFRSGSAVTRAC